MVTRSLQPDHVRILANAHSSSLAIDVVEVRITSSVEHRFRKNSSYRLELSVTPRWPNTEISFAERWPEGRFRPAGRLFLLPPDHEMFIRSDPGDMQRQRMIICQCCTSLFQNLLDEDFKPTPQMLEAGSNVTNLAIKQLMLSMGTEASNPGFASGVIMEGMALQLAGLLSREFIAMQRPRTEEAGGLAPWRLRLIDERLREVAIPPSLSELAMMCRISVRQLSRGFRQSRGIAIGQHVLERRLELAKDLLASGVSVKSAAYKLGFSSSSSFGLAFKRSTGSTPKTFRN